LPLQLLNPNPKSRLLPKRLPPKTTIPVPPNFEVKGKRAQMRVIVSLVKELEHAVDIKKEGKALGMKMDL
jgi:hypothetical protein